jgi:hypothetical protein
MGPGCLTSCDEQGLKGVKLSLDLSICTESGIQETTRVIIKGSIKENDCFCLIDWPAQLSQVMAFNMGSQFILFNSSCLWVGIGK